MCDNKPNLREFYYTSGAISSATKRFSYGYFEIKCKVPKDSAYWPAFWLWYSENDTGQEIDILEVSGYNSIQCTTYSSNVYIYKTFESHGIINASIDISQEFHTYAAEWTPHSVIFYRDNQQTRVVKGNTVPNIPLKVCINLSISPWDTVVNPFTEKSFDIEYVKIYTLQTNCDSIIISNNFNFTSHFYSLKKSYQLSNSVVPLGFPVTIRATDEIELQQGFEVPLGAEFCAMITECH
jgi:beta-glucanase (GH16 family)